MLASFSHKIGQGINGGNGYGIVESETEYNDNSWDAGSDVIYKIATAYNETYGASYNLHCDLGKSTSDPYTILGIGREIKKKMDGNIGIKIMGALSALCRYNPNTFYCFCKVAGKPPVIMEYVFGDHVAEIHRVMESGSRDYRDVDKWCDENNVISTQASFRNDIFDHPIIQEVYNTIQNEEMKETLKSITSGGQDHYTILLGKYNAPLPDDIPEGIYRTFVQSKLLYYKQLMSGKRIVYLDPDNGLHSLTGEDAVDPLGDISQFARVLCKVGVYELDDGICFTVALHTEDSRGISQTSRDFHITDSQSLISNRNFKVKLITDDIDLPDNVVHRGDFDLRISCISKRAQDDQIEALRDGDLGTRDSLRGVFCDYIRILGLPSWNCGKDSWGAVRNSGGIRGMFSFATQWFAENIASILCEKQRTNLTNAHPVLKKLFDAVIKNIIKNYSEYTMPTSIPGVRAWDLNLLYSQITKTPLPQPPRAPTPPQPPQPARVPRRPVLEDDNSTVTDVTSITGSTGSIDDDPSSRPIAFELATREVLVLNSGREIARFNNYGNGSGIRDWLKAVYDTKEDDEFIRWVNAFKYLNANHSV